MEKKKSLSGENLIFIAMYQSLTKLTVVSILQHIQI